LEDQCSENFENFSPRLIAVFMFPLRDIG